MLKNIILIFFFLFVALEVRANVDTRRDKLLNVIDEELREITRLNQRTRGQKPDLLLRMAELLLEKARLSKEVENSKFLLMSSEQRERVNRDKLFATSRSYFVQAQKTCYLILKKYPNYKHKGDVYYILAYNAKEFQDEKKAEVFFAKAIQFGRDDTTRARSQLALGEIYFNRGEFGKAIPLYERSLDKSSKDKWYTKDSYNLAWSYFREGQKTKAINLMEQVYELSKKPQYVDMSFSVERDLAYFYTDAGRTNDAIAFYRRTGKNVSENLAKVAKYLTGQGKFVVAEKALVTALDNKANESDEIDIHIQLLAMYEKFGQVDKHLNTSRRLQTFYKAGKLKPDQIETLKYHVERMSALLQKQVASKRYQSQKALQDEKATQAVGYFEILATLTPEGDYKAIFHAAETNYASGRFEQALTMYDQVITDAAKAGDQKILRLAQDGMMAALGQKGISKASEDKYLTKSYLAYLARDPKSKKSYSIYQRLFTSYYTKGEIEQAEKVLLSFKSNFPSAVKVQEAMLARLMEYHRKKKNRDAIYSWVQRINSGEFRVTKAYADKVRELLLAIQFESVEKANASGNKKEALKGYFSIYQNPNTSVEAKKNAAYNMAVLFYESGDPALMHRWSLRALEHMDGADVKKFESSFLSIGTDLFSRQEFSNAVNIYSIVLSKICREKSASKKVFFKNGVVVSLADRKLDVAKKMIEEAPQCGIDQATINESSMELLEAYRENSLWNGYRDWLQTLDGKKELQGELVYHWWVLARAYQASGRGDLANGLVGQINSTYKSALANRQKVTLEGLDVIAMLNMPELEKALKDLESTRLEFPEETYNARLQEKFQKLDRVTTIGVGILKIGSGKGIVKSYQLLIEAYEGLVREIRSFTPQGKSGEYLVSFSKSMNDLSAPLLAKASDFRREAVKQIETSDILSSDNTYFLSPSRGGQFVPEYQPVIPGIMMDRGGRK